MTFIIVYGNYFRQRPAIAEKTRPNARAGDVLEREFYAWWVKKVLKTDIRQINPVSVGFETLGNFERLRFFTAALGMQVHHFGFLQ